MLQQQMTANEVNMSGTLLIKAEPGYLAELISLATELTYRNNIESDGTIIVLPPADPPPTES